MPTRGAICWTYWYSALISQILTPKSYHRLGVFDIFSVCRGTFCNLLEQIAISGVRSVPKNTNSATILKSSPAQFVLFDMPFHPDWLVGFKHFNHDVMMCHTYTCAVRCTALQSVKWMNCEYSYMICISWYMNCTARVKYCMARARFHPKPKWNSATGGDRRALGQIGNIQNKLLKPLSGKGSPKNSATGGDALSSV